MNDKGENSSISIEVVINTNQKTSVHKWPRYYFVTPKTCILIECILIGNAMVEAAVLSLLMAYLTDKWEVKLFTAATTVNAMEGMSGLLCIATTYFKERYGCYCTVILSTIFYIVGLVILGTSAYGHMHGVLYSGLILLTLGKAFSSSSCGEDFLEDQLKAQSNELEYKNRDDVRIKISRVKCRTIGVILGNVLLAVVDRWESNFYISASIQSITLVLFFIGTPLYFMGRFQSLVHMVCLYYWQLFDKTVITKDSSPFSASSSSERRFCTIRSSDRQVKAGTKSNSLLFLVSSMAPLCFTFLMSGVVDSTGSTYFLEQGSTMDRGRCDGKDNTEGIISDTLKEVPVTILQIVMQLVRFSIKYLVHRFLSKRLRGTRATLIRIGAGLVFSVGVCSIARVVEAKRLDVVRENNLLNRPKDVVPMSILWLLPQFICLGAMQGLAVDGLVDFFQDELPDSTKSYASALTEALTGVGTLLSVFLHFIMKELSELKEGHGWFAAKNINKSRLDHVYRSLTVFSILNLLLFAYVSTSYIHGKFSTENRTKKDVSFVNESKIKIVTEVKPEEEEEEEKETETEGGDGQDKV